MMLDDYAKCLGLGIVIVGIMWLIWKTYTDATE